MIDSGEAIRLLDEAADADGRPPAGFVRRSVELPVRDESLRIVADVPDRSMRLAEIVPPVHRIDDRLVAIYLRQAAEGYKEVFCRQGCNACCRTYLIVFSPAEMYLQMEMLSALPEDRQRHVRRWLDRMDALANQTHLFERLRSLGPRDKPLEVIENWWRRQEANACPFLADGTCAIYPRRFVACREFYSHSPPETCAKCQAARMPVPLDLMNALWQLEQALTGEPTGVLSLPLMKFWSNLRAGEAERTFPAVEMVERLFEILRESAAKAQRLRGSITIQQPDPPS